MEACGVVDRSRFLETQGFVRRRANPLCAVDSAGLQRLEDFAACHGNGGRAHLRDHFAAQTWHTVLQAFEVSCGVDFLAEPTAGLRTGVTGEEGLHAELFVRFVHQLVTTHVVDPVVDFLRGHAERHSREECESRMLADVVVGRSVVGISLTGGHGIESSLRTGDQFPVRLQVDFKGAIGHRCNVVSNALCRIVYTKGAAAPGGYHGDLFTTLRDCWGGKTGRSRCTGCNTGDTCAFKKLTTFH